MEKKRKEKGKECVRERRKHAVSEAGSRYRYAEDSRSTKLAEMGDRLRLQDQALAKSRAREGESGGCRRMAGFLQRASHSATALIASTP